MKNPFGASIGIVLTILLFLGPLVPVAAFIPILIPSEVSALCTLQSHPLPAETPMSTLPLQHACHTSTQQTPHHPFTSFLRNMGEEFGTNADSSNHSRGQRIYRFSLASHIPSALMEQLHSQVLKEASQTANYPGIRTGHVPPYAIPEIRSIAVRKAILQTVLITLDSYGLHHVVPPTTNPGNLGLEVAEDMLYLAKTFRVGQDIPFTATFQVTGTPDSIPPEGTTLEFGGDIH